MKKLIQKWLGISNIEEYLNSREACKICGYHRYTKRLDKCILDKPPIYNIGIAEVERVRRQAE